MDVELNDREEALWRAFTMMSRQLHSSVEQRLQADAGISSADFEILQALTIAPGNRARAGELADMLTWERSRISHHVARMESRQLVERISCDTDQRGVWVTIAAAGRAALAQAAPGHADALRHTFLDLLTGADAEVLAASALKVIRATDAGSCTHVVDAIEAQFLTPQVALGRDV